MTLNDLLKKGYFAQELPPPFNTDSFGDNYSKIISIWNSFDNSIKVNYKETKYSQFSIPKVGFARRIIGVPNPIHFSQLSETICNNWKAIEKIYSQSNLSASKPVVNNQKGRAVKTAMTFGEFKHNCIINSFDRIYELKTDIAKYYPSIYTHTLAWAVHTKLIAKANRTDLSLLGNKLDLFAQKGQSGQTAGVPIGPDTSLILSEILGCTFDKQLKKKFPNLNGLRFVDDYYLYFSTQAEAEQVFKYLQSLVTDYTLSLNEEKTRIRKFPFEYESEWASALNDFKISDKITSQAGNLFTFLSVAFKYSNLYPTDSVLKYAIKKLSTVAVKKQNWNLYESLIFKACVAEPAILPDILKILLTYETWVSKTKLRRLVKELITTHCFKGNSFEVSWSLWIAKTFKIKISKPLAERIFQSNDFFSILVALDLKEAKLLTANTSHLKLELELEAFKDERWLFAYESIIKKWIIPTTPDLLLKTKYFQTLKKSGVTFYDATRQVEKIKFGKKVKTKIPIVYSKTESLIMKPDRLSELLKNVKTKNVIPILDY